MNGLFKKMIDVALTMDMTALFVCIDDFCILYKQVL